MSDAELKAAPKEGELPPEGEHAEGGKKSKKKIIIIAAAVLVLLIGLGAGAYFMGFLDKFLPHHEVNCEEVKEGDEGYEECAKKAAEAAGEDVAGTFVDIPDMIVNLNATTKQPRFLKISLKVELEKAEDQKKFEEVLPRVIDQFQTYLRELRIEDLRGSSGMYRMKIELLNRVKAAAPSVKVRDVLFQEILVQ